MLNRRTIWITVRILLESLRLRRGEGNSVTVSAHVLRLALIHHFPDHNAHRRTDWCEHHRPAGQRAGILVLDTQNGKQKAAEQSGDQE